MRRLAGSQRFVVTKTHLWCVPFGRSEANLCRGSRGRHKRRPRARRHQRDDIHSRVKCVPFYFLDSYIKQLSNEFICTKLSGVIPKSGPNFDVSAKLYICASRVVAKLQHLLQTPSLSHDYSKVQRTIWQRGPYCNIMFLAKSATWILFHHETSMLSSDPL